MYMRTAPKVMPLILLSWPMTSEVDVVGIAVDSDPSHQYSITFCCHVTDGNREAAWQNSIWHGSVYEAKVYHWIPPCRKNRTHICWTFMDTKQWMWAQWSGRCCVSAVATATLWMAIQTFTSWLLIITGGNILLMVVTMLKKKVFCSWELALSVLLCSLYLLYLPC